MIDTIMHRMKRCGVTEARGYKAVWIAITPKLRVGFWYRRPRRPRKNEHTQWDHFPDSSFWNLRVGRLAVTYAGREFDEGGTPCEQGPLERR